MRFRLIVLAMLGVFSVGAPALALTMSGSSWTSRDDALFIKMLNGLSQFVQRQYGCQDISDIRSEILPQYQFAVAPPEAIGPLYHERWLVTMCGKRREFVFTLFHTKNGGTGWSHNVPPD